MFSSEQSYPGLGDTSLKRQQRFSATDMLEWYLESFPSTASETGIISDEWTDRHTDGHVIQYPATNV